MATSDVQIEGLRAFEQSLSNAVSGFVISNPVAGERGANCCRDQ
ncbi:hypothetical protein [Limnobacter sp.]|nr:hypothetical protein [Limnobacter sp.]